MAAGLQKPAATTMGFIIPPSRILLVERAFPRPRDEADLERVAARSAGYGVAGSPRPRMGPLRRNGVVDCWRTGAIRWDPTPKLEDHRRS